MFLVMELLSDGVIVGVRLGLYDGSIEGNYDDSTNGVPIGI